MLGNDPFGVGLSLVAFVELTLVASYKITLSPLDVAATTGLTL